MRLRFKRMTAQQGLSEWDDVVPPTNIEITVDANQQTQTADHIATVVHELLHVVFLPMCLGWLTDEMEEVVILALDAHMNAYIRKSPARLHQWEEIIHQKIAETDARDEKGPEA